jgi:hypothetical protein
MRSLVPAAIESVNAAARMRRSSGANYRGKRTPRCVIGAGIASRKRRETQRATDEICTATFATGASASGSQRAARAEGMGLEPTTGFPALEFQSSR